MPDQMHRFLTWCLGVAVEAGREAAGWQDALRNLAGLGSPEPHYVIAPKKLALSSEQ